MRAGLKKAEVFVGDFEPKKIVEIYAKENALQRGNSGTAVTGSVAGALRMVAYQNLVKEKVPQLGEPLPTGDQKSAQGIGSPQLIEALEGVPGIGKAKVVSNRK